MMEKVIDPVDLSLGKRVVQELIERLCRGQILAERLLDDEPDVSGQVNRSERFDNGCVQRRRQRQIDHGRLVDSRQGLGHLLGITDIGPTVLEHLEDCLTQGSLQSTGMAIEPLTDVSAKALRVPVLTRDSQDSKLRWQPSTLEKGSNGRHEIAACEIAGCTEYDK